VLADDYAARLAVWSDIQDHMPRLHETASRYPEARVLELGVRSGNSTSAFLAAAAQVGGHVWSVDIAAPVVPGHWHRSPLWTLTVADDMTLTPRELLPHGLVDVLFIDTSHDYAHTLAELHRYVPAVAPGGTVLLHDTRLRAPPEAPPQDPYPVARALDGYCAVTGRAWAEHGGPYGLGEICDPNPERAG
jgi:predicted O-methyltransferase YrrM